SENAASLGAISFSTACMGLLFIVPVNVPNIEFARLNGRAESSNAATVFSNVAGAFVSTIAWMSLRPSSMPLSSAPLKSLTLILSNGGTPPYGPVHGASNGSDGIFAPPLANDRRLRNEMRTAEAPAENKKERLNMAAGT